MKQLHFAPLQGYTQFAFRNIHNRHIGGISHYYSPFIRWEKGGIRKKDLVDIAPENNDDTPLVPQIIAGNSDEFNLLCDAVQAAGYKRIDLNMGCPAPMQTKLKRGSALVANPQLVEDLALCMKRRPEINFSVKMRLGWQEENEWENILPILHDTPLSHITLHPRVGIQQYKGEVNMNQFARFYEACRLPLIYNGDIQCLGDIKRLEDDFPNLSGIMIGRGLLGNPFLSAEYEENSEWETIRRRDAVLQMHDEWLEFCREKYVSDAQVLLQIKTFWEYQNAWIEKKVYKRIMKSGSFRNYMDAVRMINTL